MGQDTGKPGNAISAPASVARMVEDIVGCKWSLAVLGAIRRSILRPGAIERSIAGISTKVLNERLVFGHAIWSQPIDFKEGQF